jgi:hypothetical protein
MRKGSWAPGRGRFKRDTGLTQTLAKAVWVCSGCGLWHDEKPAQCQSCGWLKFDKFDSKAEARHWAELLVLQWAGQITELRRQVRFPLFAHSERGHPVQVAQYVADFVYREDGVLVVADAKSAAVTDVAALKLRWFHAQYGYEVRLVRSSGGKAA